MRVPSSEQPDGWYLLHTKNSLVIDGQNIPAPQPVPLHGPGGKVWPAGTRFIFLGGNKTSAAFEWIDFRKTKPAEYLGQIKASVNDHESDVAVFKQEGFPCLFGWHVHGEELFWGNHTNASRVIEMHRATVEGQQVPGHSPNGKASPRGRSRTNWPEFHVCNACWHVQRYDRTNHDVRSCTECKSPDVDVFSSRRKDQRAHFDELQRHHGDALDHAPPLPPD